MLPKFWALQAMGGANWSVAKRLNYTHRMFLKSRYIKETIYPSNFYGERNYFSRTMSTLIHRLLKAFFDVKAEGLTAIECWVIACIIFVFGALLEYTVILLKLKLKRVTMLNLIQQIQTNLIQSRSHNFLQPK